MSNLLPEEQKKILRQAYLFRVATVVLLAIFASVVVALAGLLPAYFATTYKMAILEEEVKGLRNVASEKKEGELLTASMQDINSKLEMLEKWSKEVPAYKDMLKAIEERGKGVVITTLVYDRKNASIVLSGTADERDNLLAFKTGLENSGKFKAVNLPVSNLAQKEDIDFSLTISLVKP